MRPNLRGGELLTVEPAGARKVRRGMIVLAESENGLQAHRVTALAAASQKIETRGDAGWASETVDARAILGCVTHSESPQGLERLDTHSSRFRAALRRAGARLSAAAGLRRRWIFSLGLFLAALLALSLAAAAPASAQTSDLGMTQTAAPSVVQRGNNITYTEVVTNNGPNDVNATTVVYQQTPPNTTFVSATSSDPTNWNCTNNPGVGNTGQILCDSTGNLANGATVTFTIVVNVNAATAAGTTIVNSADVTSQSADPLAANDATTTTVLAEQANAADLGVTASASPTPVFVFSTLTYTLQVQNYGTISAAVSTLTDILPAGLTFGSANSTQGTCVNAAGTVTCTLGTITTGTVVTVTIIVTTPATATTLTNTATVTTTTTDPVPGNNSATVITVVQPLVCASPGRDGAGGTLSGIVNAYYPPGAGVGTVNAGSASILLGAAAAGGAQTPIAAGDLLLVIQMQDASINSTNTSAYGDGLPGDPGSGSTNLNSSGEFEFVTSTSAVPIGGGTLTFVGTGASAGLLNTYVSGVASATQGLQTFQIIRVPQFTTAALSSGLAAMRWNGATGGVLALDVASQLTLNGTVSTDGLGFRGGAGIKLTGGTGAETDYVTLSTDATNGSKGEGIAGTPRFVVNGNLSNLLNTNQTYAEGLPNGSYARGAPGNAGGGGTDADPVANDQNDGGGAGGNGGTGGEGGYGWKSAGIVGGFGGVAFPASTGAIILGGGAGAGTTNNGTADPTNANPAGINSSGAAGGGIVIIHAGNVTGTGTISANGQTALNVQNDGGGGGGAGGSILLFANSGLLSGATVQANGGNGGDTWSTQAPGAFPGNRHGPGGGGGGGVVLLSAAAGSASVAGGVPGHSTLANDAYGATPGGAGITQSGISITQTPGTQSGAYCASADLAVTNSGTPNPVVPGGNITYTQTIINNGLLDAVNATLVEAVPANTTFQSLTSVPAGWTCVTPAVGNSGNISCSNPDIANGSLTTFTLNVKVNAGATNGSQIVDTVNATAGTNDPNLANNTATVLTVVGQAGSSDLVISNSASPNPVLAGADITSSIGVQNNGPATSSAVGFSDAIPANTTFVSLAIPAGWSCLLPSVGGTGTITCSIATLGVGGTANFSLVVMVNAATPSGTAISDTASVLSATPDPNPSSNTATATVIVATAGQADLAVTKVGTPNPVLPGNNISYTIKVTNNGPAAATSVQLTDTLPANTTFVSDAPIPGGWTCPAPVGGVLTCTNPSMVLNASSTFSLVLKVAPATVPGTTITNSVTISAATSDPFLGNNTASTSSVVTSPTDADVAIIKTAAPEPVDQGTNLTYTLQVINNGPAVAQGVSVTDPLPAQVTYVSASTTMGSCSQTAGTVTCNLGSMGVGALAVITINVNAATFSSGTLAVNTATVTSTTVDPNLTNNTSTAISTIQAPTAVQITSFSAQVRPAGGVILSWDTREETRNLGFHIYRVDAQARHRVDPSLIAGSALFLRGGSPQHAAKTYEWVDPQGTASSSYVLEDVDLNGTRTTHGPVTPNSMAQANAAVAQAPLLDQMNQAMTPVFAPSMRVMRTPDPQIPSLAAGGYRVSVDAQPAVKISITSEGWYRITRNQLVAAGLEPFADARMLQLYSEGVEQPLLILGKPSGPLQANDSIEFYGTGIDTPFSATRVYWLVRGSRPGKRISVIPAGSQQTPEVSSFPFTSLLEQRTTYFAALLNGEDNDNYFGALVSSEPVDQTLTAANIDPNSSIPVTLDVDLQGVTDGQEHRVSIALNGASIGEMDFVGMANSTITFAVEPGILQEGANTVTLTALEGDNDVSLVQSIALHYAHTYTADANYLRATVPAGDTLTLRGFTSPGISIYDITDPEEITELSAPSKLDGAAYDVTLEMPGPASQGTRTLLALSADQISAPDALAFHPASTLTEQRRGADIVIITHPEFEASLTPLVQLRERQGHDVALVTDDQIFDAFSYGERTPFAIRDYLEWAAAEWRDKPQALLLAGDASVDPRNYLGFGDFDFVPTRIIQTAAFKTASDDWFTDFKGNGFASIPTGRLPVRTPAEAALVVSKIVNYERGGSSANWNRQALVIADQNVGVDFTSEANFASTNFPSSVSVTKILADGQDPATVHNQILAALNNGAVIVNYTGHGSEEQWSFADLFDDSSATALTNGGRLPVFLLMDCLNGFFHDVYATSLSTSILLAPNGGGVAVWASSGFTNAPPQAGMDQALLHVLSANPSTPIGQAILKAKSGVSDPDVRRTWILFGDPSMRIAFPGTGAR